MESDQTIKLIIPGQPKAQKRHRSAIRLRKGAKSIKAVNKKNCTIEKLYRKKDLFIHNYDPSWKDKKEMSRMIGALAPEPPLRGPVRVDRFYYFLYLDGHYGTGRNAGKVKYSAPIWKQTREDIDNCDKLLFDVLSGLFFKDDGQICAGVQIKQYSTIPRTEVFITPLGKEDAKEQLDELHIQADRQLAQAKKQETQELPF